MAGRQPPGGKSGSYDVVHIHFAYLGWIGILGRYPYFLHCHGSDVRRDLHDRLRRWPIMTSLRRARAVLFVTPDLAPIVRPIRSDAIFLPDPVNTDRFTPQPNHGRAPTQDTDRQRAARDQASRHCFRDDPHPARSPPDDPGDGHRPRP